MSLYKRTLINKFLPEGIPFHLRDNFFPEEIFLNLKEYLS